MQQFAQIFIKDYFRAFIDEQKLWLSGVLDITTPVALQQNAVFFFFLFFVVV